MKARLTRFCLGVALLWAAFGSFVSEAADTGWRLAFEDQFERAELGGDWDVYWGGTSVAQGRMHLRGSPAVAILNRSFPSDVRLEFEAEVDPTLPPCDVACGLAGNHFVGYGYLLQFGAQNNQCNQLMTPLKGRGKQGLLQVVRSPPFKLEYGKTYICVAAKEGNRLTYHVNGVKLLDVTDTDALGGAPLDRVCLVTWNGMYVDKVKVYVRATPVPSAAVFLEDPKVLDVGYRWNERALSFVGGQPLPQAIQRGIQVYNDRRYEEAHALFAGVNPPTRESVAGLSYVVGDLAFQESDAQRETLVRLAGELARRNPSDQGAAAFALLADWFQQVTIISRDKQNSERLHAIGPANNPFYYKNELLRARFQLAIAQESGYARNRKQAQELFAALVRLWPDHAGLAQLTGEKIPWSRELIRPAGDGPPWARHLQEGLARSHAVLNWWFTKRQAPDGSLGGGWGDDVELMRSWGMPACVTTAGETAIAGIQRLAGGVWTHALAGLEVDVDEGRFGDIEHGAEPAADTHPLLLLLRYGDPEYVERNLRMAKFYRDVLMGVNARGGLQFKSCEYNLREANLHPSAVGQNIYHCRAMRHIVWLAWLGLPEARDILIRWADNLREVAMAEIGPKPAGYMPFTIFWPSGSIYPPDGRSWLDPKAHYYGTWARQLEKYHFGLYSAYFVSRQRRFLEPLDRMFEMASMSARPLPHDESLPRDHPRNLLADFTHQNSPALASLYHWLTGSSVHDGHGLTAPLQFVKDQDLERFAKTFEPAVEGLRFNWDLMTSEVLQTDRMDLPGDFALFGGYTGAATDLLEDALVPSIAVTWDTPNLDFAAVVLSSSAERLRVLVYSFNETAVPIGIRPWLLTPGVYLVNCGEKSEKEARTIRWEKPVVVTYKHRGTPLYVEVPSRKPWVVDLRLQEQLRRPAALPDLAVAARDLRVKGNDVVVTIHNIGSTASGAFEVVLQTAEGERWHEVAKTKVAGLPGITNLSAVRRDATFRGVAGKLGRKYRVVVDPQERAEESYELNNAVTLQR